MPNLPNPDDVTRLKAFRLAASFSQRELASLIGETHTNIAYWKTRGNLPRSNALIPKAKALGVSVEEILGQPKPKRASAPAGRARQLFEAVFKMLRRQQEKILGLLEPFVAVHSSGH